MVTAHVSREREWDKVAQLWLLRMCLERVGQTTSPEFVWRNHLKQPGYYQCPQPMESASNLPTNTFRHSRRLDINRKLLFVCGATAPQLARASSSTRFLDHTQRHTTLGRTPLGEWSARRRVLYLTTHNTTDVHAHRRIRTHILSTRAAADLRLRPCGHWDRQQAATSWT
jgi:hypothetical protein